MSIYTHIERESEREKKHNLTELLLEYMNYSRYIYIAQKLINYFVYIEIIIKERRKKIIITTTNSMNI